MTIHPRTRVTSRSFRAPCAACAAAAVALAATATRSAGAAVLTTSEAATFAFVVGSATPDPFAGTRAPLTTQHADIGLPYASGGWDLHWHDGDADVEHEPDAAYVRATDAALLTRPAGSAWDFTGAAAGQAFHVLPQAQTPGVVFLGIATEENAPDLQAPWDPLDPRSFGHAAQTRMELVSVTGPEGAAAPGVFSAWQNNGIGGTTVLISSNDGIDASDALYVSSGGHAHFNFGFSAPGVYEVTVRATTGLVPEPAGLALVAVAGTALLARRHRDRRAPSA